MQLFTELLKKTSWLCTYHLYGHRLFSLKCKCNERSWPTLLQETWKWPEIYPDFNEHSDWSTLYIVKEFYCILWREKWGRKIALATGNSKVFWDKMTMMWVFFAISPVSLDLKHANYSFTLLKLSGEDEQKARDLVCHGWASERAKADAEAEGGNTN